MSDTCGNFGALHGVPNAFTAAGFGEGNFRALFESIEQDQIDRGVLKAS